VHKKIQTDMIKCLKVKANVHVKLNISKAAAIQLNQNIVFNIKRKYEV